MAFWLVSNTVLITYHVPHESILVEQKTFFGSTPKIESGNTLEEEFFLIKPAEAPPGFVVSSYFSS